METPVILSAVRTPVGKFQGGLSSFTAPELGAKVIAEAARRAGIETKQIDEAILGNVLQAGLGQNPARQAALKGGCDPRVAALTINKVCGSGLKAVGLAAQVAATTPVMIRFLLCLPMIWGRTAAVLVALIRAL